MADNTPLPRDDDSRGLETQRHGASPLITIVTPTLNCAAFIGSALESLQDQGGVAVEHIVVDGGSSDTTADIVRAWGRSDLIVAPGLGLYDSLNRGIEHASGAIIGFLNGDDLYKPGTLDWVADQFEQFSDSAVVSGCAMTFASDAERGQSPRMPADSPRLDWDTVLFGVPAINARFFRRDVFARVGMFSSAYRIAADREFLIRVLRASLPERATQRLVYEYRMHAGSLTLDPARRQALNFAREHMQIAEVMLGDEDIDARGRTALRLWYEESLVTGLTSAVRNGDYAALPGLLWNSRRRWALPVTLPRAVMRKLVRRWSRR